MAFAMKVPKSAHRLLSRDQEREALRRCRHDPQAIAALLEGVMPWIYLQIAPYLRTTTIDRRDLVQAACEAVCIAAWRYDERFNTRFLTYASDWIRCRVQLELDGSSTVRPGRTETGGVKRILPVFMSSLDEPDVDRSACADGSSEPAVERLADRAPLPDDVLEAKERAEVVPQLVTRLLGQLRERERFVVTYLYLQHPERTTTLEELAPVLGVTAERVRQIRNKALSKMRAVCAADRVLAEVAAC